MQVTKEGIWNSTVQFPQDKQDQQSYVDAVQGVVSLHAEHSISWLETFDKAVRSQVGSDNLQVGTRVKNHFTTRFYLWSRKHPGWATALKVLSCGVAILIGQVGRRKYEANDILINIAESVTAISQTIADRKQELRVLEKSVLTSLKTQDVVFGKVLTQLDELTQKNEGKLDQEFYEQLRAELKDNPQRFLHNPNNYQDDKQHTDLTKLFERVQCAPQITQMRSDKKVYEQCKKWDSLASDIKKELINRIKGGHGQFAPLLQERIDTLINGLSWQVFSKQEQSKRKQTLEEAHLIIGGDRPHHCSLKPALDWVAYDAKNMLSRELSWEALHSTNVKEIVEVLGLAKEHKAALVRVLCTQLRNSTWEELHAVELIKNVETLGLKKEYEQAKRRIIEGLEESVFRAIKRREASFKPIVALLDEILQKGGKFDKDFAKSLQHYLATNSRTFLSIPSTYTNEEQYTSIANVLERMQCVAQVKELQSDKQVYTDCSKWNTLAGKIQKKHVERMMADENRFAPLIETRVQEAASSLVWNTFTTISQEQQRSAVELVPLLKQFNGGRQVQQALNSLITHVKTQVIPNSSLEQLESESFRSTVAILGLTNDSKLAYAFQKGRYLSKEIKQLEAGKLPGWQESAVTLIRNNRFDNFVLEMERLKGANAYTDAEFKAIEAAVNGVYLEDSNKPHRKTLSLQAKVLYMQAHEMKRLYEKTHHIFLHAQSLKWSIVPQLIKELISVFTPDVDLHHFKFLRTEGDVIPDTYWEMLTSWNFTHFVKSLFGYAKPVPKTAREYIDSTPIINDSNLETRAKILSADGFFYNYSPYESALHFLMNNSNILGSDGETALKNVVKSTLSHFNSNASAYHIEELATRLLKSTQFTNKLTTTGNLYVIALPKDTSADVQYRAHPFGPACRCHQGSDHNSIVEKLQKGILDADTKCTQSPHPVVPQFRLYLPALKPGEGRRMIRLNALDREDHHRIKATVKKVAKELQEA